MCWASSEGDALTRIVQIISVRKSAVCFRLSEVVPRCPLLDAEVEPRTCSASSLSSCAPAQGSQAPEPCSSFFYDNCSMEGGANIVSRLQWRLVLKCTDDFTPPAVLGEWFFVASGVLSSSLLNCGVRTLLFSFAHVIVIDQPAWFQATCVSHNLCVNSTCAGAHAHSLPNLLFIIVILIFCLRRLV